MSVHIQLLARFNNGVNVCDMRTPMNINNNFVFHRSVSIRLLAIVFEILSNHRFVLNS